MIEDTKKAYDKAKEQEIKEINQVFNKIIKQLEQKKQLMVSDINQKRTQMSHQLDTLFHSSFQSMKEVAHMDQQLLEYDHQYSKSDFEIVKDYNTRGDPRIFQNFCESYDQAFLEFSNKLEEVRNNQFVKHNFQLLLNEELLNTFVSSAIFVEATDLDISEFIQNNRSPNLTKTNNTILDKTGGVSMLEDNKNDETNKDIYDSPMRKNQKVKINQKRSNKKLVSIKPSKVLTPQSQLYFIDRDTLRVRFFAQESSIAYNVGHQLKTLRDMRSIMLNHVVYLFDSTETHLSEFLYYFNMEQKQFIQIDPSFEFPRRKISACTYQDRYIIFTGEFESNKVERGPIEKFDTVEGTFSQISGLNISSCNYVLCIVNERYLYAFPISINTHKLQVLDLRANEDGGSLNVSKRSSPLKEGGSPNYKWSKVQHKLPLNFRVFLNYKSQAIQINLEEILITGSKTSYIYNFKKEEFTHYYNYVLEDEFLDGLYKSEANQNQIIGMGNQGLHIFDYLSRKWQLYDELNYLNNQE